MRVICAWCQHEGRSGLLRVREPLDDPTDTHGICDRHQQAALEAFPSSSFPTTRWLFIVAAGDLDAYNHLERLLQRVPGATVIVDRRHGERRHPADSPALDRRRFDRRVRRAEMSSLGYGLIRFTARGAPLRSPEASSPEPPADDVTERRDTSEPGAADVDSPSKPESKDRAIP